ncbi:MAG: cytochrome c [Candidatus Solibacter usitatus]|nr:cytochrome c [Candidatus Solibacter usitatus]
MSNYLIIPLLFLGGVLAAQTEVRKVPVQPTPASSGPEMYKTYCASCHGLDGKGRGPAAAAMKAPLPDLTTLSRRNGGKYPELRVVNSINGEAGLSAHGGKEMPVWGYVFREMKGGSGEEASLRLRNLTRHIQSLQQP